MIKHSRLAILWMVFFLVSLGTALGQQRYKTHAVKKGETIYSIAKQYRVTPYSILQENQEIKNAEEVKPNTILIIPVGGDYQGDTITKPIQKKDNEEKPAQVAPIGYTDHKVKKRETIFAITQKYGITEDQLRRYNTQLYAQRLKKGMVLRIPKYPEVVEEEERPLDFETYTVQAKETRWSIAHKYGITVDSLLLLNPELSKENSHLAIGQSLQLPRPKGDSLQEQEVTIFESFIVPKAMGLFRISQNYGISVDSVMQLNPEIKALGGLKEGMELRLPKPKPVATAINTDHYIFYVVKPKQNIFRLTQNLNISRDSLYLLNPALEKGLKAGMVLKLPKAKGEVLDVKNALVIDKVNLIDSLDVTHRPSVLMLLPFRLDRINFENTEKTENQVGSRKDITYAMGLYTGALVAADSLKKMGVSVDLKVIDTELSLEQLKLKLAQESFVGVDAVFGPVGPNLLGEVAVRANNRDIPVIAPFAAEGQLSLANVFYTNPNTAVLRERLLQHMASVKENQNIIVIADQKHQAVKDSILARFPMAKAAKMSKDGSLHLVDFQTMLSETEENWVFVETDQPNLAASISSILNASNSEITDEESGDMIKTVVKMFTTNYNSAFESPSISRPHLSNLSFTFPAAFKFQAENSFTKAYTQKFGHGPDRYAVRGFDLMMDLLLKLGSVNNLYLAAHIAGQTEYAGNRFNYFTDGTSGYYNRATYLLQYQDLRIIQLETK